MQKKGSIEKELQIINARLSQERNNYEKAAYEYDSKMEELNNSIYETEMEFEQNLFRSIKHRKQNMDT
ncbi:MAG: hypothetical protein ABR502_05565 [Chitinophagaceae bacterium]